MQSQKDVPCSLNENKRKLNILVRRYRKLTEKGQRKSEWEREGERERERAVSYTHLDVYKRQVQKRYSNTL